MEKTVFKKLFLFRKDFFCVFLPAALTFLDSHFWVSVLIYLQKLQVNFAVENNLSNFVLDFLFINIIS